MRKIIIAKLILVVFVLISVFNHNNHVKAFYDDDLNQKNIYDWTDVLNDYSNHKNKIYTGPYYKIGLIGKHDQVHIGDDITLEFRLFDNYIGSNKMTSQIKNMNQVQFESRTLTNNVGITTSTTIGQTSVAELGLSYNETDKANISQESNFSSTFTFQNIYTSSKMSSVSMSYDYDVSVIPDNKPIFTYGKVAVFVK